MAKRAAMKEFWSTICLGTPGRRDDEHLSLGEMLPSEVKV